MFYGKLTYGKNVIWQRISIKFGPLGLDVTFYRPAVFAEHGGRLSLFKINRMSICLSFVRVSVPRRISLRFILFGGRFRVPPPS